MRAFVMRRIGEVGFADKPPPQPGPGDAIVRTTLALVCTSDVRTVWSACCARSATSASTRAC
jgi:isopropanol dehydrogenase (NADP+)